MKTQKPSFECLQLKQEFIDLTEKPVDALILWLILNLPPLEKEVNCLPDGFEGWVFCTYERFTVELLGCYCCQTVMASVRRLLDAGLIKRKQHPLAQWGKVYVYHVTSAVTWRKQRARAAKKQI